MQVRREFITIKSSENGGQLQESKLKRVFNKSPY